MRQRTFAEVGFDVHRKLTRRDRFLAEMERIVPWDALMDIVKAKYPSGRRGRPPIGLDRMLRIHLLQQWFHFSDPEAEEALYDSHAMRRFVGIDLGREAAPDETTICRFRHFLERHGFGEAVFGVIGRHLAERGVKVRQGTIMDATIVKAPSSRKNVQKARDPEMGTTKKGGRYHFGMKAHIGVDSETKQIHSVAVTAANVHDSQVVAHLRHGKEARVGGDKAYAGQGEAIGEKAPGARDLTLRKAARNRPLTVAEKRENGRRSRIRARVEHPFLVMKRVFGYGKVRYRGHAKNAHQIIEMCGLVNLFMARRRLLACPPL